jgi:hypothetical protein
MLIFYTKTENVRKKSCVLAKENAAGAQHYRYYVRVCVNSEGDTGLRPRPIPLYAVLVPLVLPEPQLVDPKALSK